MFPEDLGCESSLILQDTSGQVYSFGSIAGYSFLCLNPDINTKLQDHFGTYYYFELVILSGNGGRQQRKLSRL